MIGFGFAEVELGYASKTICGDILLFDTALMITIAELKPGHNRIAELKRDCQTHKKYKLVLIHGTQLWMSPLKMSELKYRAFQCQAAGPHKLERQITVNAQLRPQVRDSVRVKTGKIQMRDYFINTSEMSYLSLFRPIWPFARQLPAHLDSS